MVKKKSTEIQVFYVENPKREKPRSPETPKCLTIYKKVQAVSQAITSSSSSSERLLRRDHSQSHII